GQAITGGSVIAITGGSGQAITGGSVSAITGGSGQAITGGSVIAITGGSGQAITGGSVSAITGGSGQAITGGSISAITGGSGQAITGGSIHAITGGSGQAITGGSVHAITAGSHSILLVGPIDSLDRANGTFNALGQTVTMPDGIFGDLGVGDYVYVGGSITGAGTIAASDVGRMGGTYVPGASEVFVTGIPSSVDFSRGTATMGGLTFDYTPSLGGDSFEGIGAAVTVIGRQPALGGTLIGEAVLDKTELFLGD
ncbi:MAG: hypothetical protein AAF351_07500, partial [Pseudomonadota bacterium]